MIIPLANARFLSKYWPVRTYCKITVVSTEALLGEISSQESTRLSYLARLNWQLMYEAEYLMKNYGDRGRCYPSRPRGITPSEICIILQMIRKPNSIIVLFFIQNTLFLVLKHAYLHRSIDINKFIFDSARLGCSAPQIADVALRVVFLLFLPFF